MSLAARPVGSYIRFQTVVTFTDLESYSTALNVTLNA